MIIRKKRVYAYLMIFLLVVTIVPPAVLAQSAHRFSSSSGAGFVSRQPQPTFQSLYGSQATTYWPILGDRATCDARSDLLLNVAPAGCEPTIVRSDLLAEQNVPVFCQIDALEINPLVDVSQIRNVRFVGDTPEEVAGIGFHPARAAVRSGERLLGAPLANNIGYVVVVLKRQPDESKLPDFVNVSLAAAIEYDSGNSLGIGQSEFILDELNDNEWENEKFKHSFWNGRYFMRLDEVDSNFARVSIYDGVQRLVSTQVQRGQTSEPIYVPGLFCRAGFEIQYSGFVSAEERARIEVSTGSSADVFEVTSGSRFLNNRCTVTDIDVNTGGETGRVRISCSGGSLSSGSSVFGGGRFDLILGSKSPSGELIVDGLSVAPEVDANSNYRVNLNGLSDSSRRGVYVFSSVEELCSETSTRCDIIVDSSGNFIGEGSTPVGLRNWYLELWRKINSYKSADASSVSVSSDAKKYFNDAIGDYETVADDFPGEGLGVLGETESFGEEALRKGINLAQKFGENDVERRLINKLSGSYSNSEYSTRIEELGKIDSSNAALAVDVDGQTRVVRLLSLEDPVDKTSAELRIDGSSFDVDLRERKELPGGFGEIILERAEPDEIILGASCQNSQGVVSSSRERHTLRLDGTSRSICGLDVRLTRVNTEELAKIRLIPRTEGTQSLANFTVNIGIEKRALEITPEKARKKIDNLNDTIKDWEDASESLGDVVTGLKSACFATSALLTFKNFASGLSGESLARQQVMNGDNGWRERCEERVGNGEYQSLDHCYTSNAGDIDSEVATQLAALNKVNGQIQQIQGQHVTTDGGLANIFGSYADEDAVRDSLANYARQEYGSVQFDLNDLDKEWIGADGQPTTSISVADILSPENVQMSVVSTDAIREIMLNAELKRSGVGGEHLQNVEDSFVETADRINENRIVQQDIASAVEDEKRGYPRLARVESPDARRRTMPVNSINSVVRQETGFGSEVTHVARARVSAGRTVAGSGELGAAIEKFPPGIYTLGLRGDAQRGVFDIVEVKQEGGQLITGAEVSDFTDAYKLSTIEDQGRVSLNNEIKGDDRQCRFYETEPYRGMPAIIPFDTRNGWYAATRQTLPVFGGIGAFDASGRVTSFWLCNVGEDGEVDFNSGFDDDLCQQVNLNTGQPLGEFPGLSASEARSKINDAVRAIQDAARQYPNQFITVNGQRCEVGKPSTGQPGTQCQDFMSPSDCHILFNVCDPVVCPNSRCNFGGTYNVANVAQTGIVGSTLLCLPNIQEGIVIPVCLTGIQAGIDGWVSIMRNYRDCLQENLENGETVGICDQINSVYLCEFFWGQVAPFVNVLVPKLIEVAYGQGVRGGGEYLTVQGAWQNMQNSINFFTQSYAVNSLTAFQVRNEGQYGQHLYSSASVAELGAEVCQTFISAKAPKAFEALVEPDSPPQFQAWFDEKTFTTATVPATSQYKVFYHIFAGKDAGVNFQVYLKNPPQSSFYASNPFVVVDSGYVARGEYASETRDFTAPQGYKELCVRVNNQEECGFGQVSTSFAIDYLRDVYVSDELQKVDVTTEQECVSGSPSPGALLTPNIQSGFEEVANPAIYNRGVTRICATDNPGLGTNPERFVNVGFCTDRDVGCWLDTQSVDRALSRENVGIRNQTLEVLQDRTRDFLENSGEVFSEAQANDELDELERKLGELGGSTVVNDGKALLSEADFVLDKLFFNQHKARLYLIRGQISEKIALALKSGEDVNKASSSSDDFVGPPLPSDEDLENVFTIDRAGEESMFLRYDDSVGWEWSIDRDGFWVSVVNKAIEQGEFVGPPLPSENVELLDELEGADYELGVAIIQSSGADVVEESSTGFWTNVWEGITSGGQQEEGQQVSEPAVQETSSEYNLVRADGNTEEVTYLGEPTGIVIVDGRSVRIELSTGGVINAGSVENDLIRINSFPPTDGIGATAQKIEEVRPHLAFLDGKSYIAFQRGEFVFDSDGRDAEAQRLASARGSGWTLVSALQEVIGRTGGYSDNFNNVFVDQLLTDGLISSAERDDVEGVGLFNLEEDMRWVEDLLLSKIEIFRVNFDFDNTYFRYVEFWEWTDGSVTDGFNGPLIGWVSVPNLISGNGHQPPPEVMELIRNLQGKGFGEGKLLLSQFSAFDEEGNAIVADSLGVVFYSIGSGGVLLFDDNPIGVYVANDLFYLDGGGEPIGAVTGSDRINFDFGVGFSGELEEHLRFLQDGDFGDLDSVGISRVSG